MVRDIEPVMYCTQKSPTGYRYYANDDAGVGRDDKPVGVALATTLTHFVPLYFFI